MLGVLCLMLLVSSGSLSAPVDFVRDVRPIFQKHCYECHGKDAQKSGFRLDVKSRAFKGGDAYGQAIIPGKVNGSVLYELVTSDDDDARMPPKSARLTPAELDVLKRWIEEGAIWPDGIDLVTLKDPLDHWSFKPRREFATHQTIDQFIDAKLAERGFHVRRRQTR